MFSFRFLVKLGYVSMLIVCRLYLCFCFVFDKVSLDYVRFCFNKVRLDYR